MCRLTFFVSVLLDVEPGLLMLILGRSRCLVTGERSKLDRPAAWGVAPIRRAAATSNKRGERIIHKPSLYQTIFSLAPIDGWPSSIHVQQGGWGRQLSCRRLKVVPGRLKQWRGKKSIIHLFEVWDHLEVLCVTKALLRGLTASFFHKNVHVIIQTVWVGRLGETCHAVLTLSRMYHECRTHHYPQDRRECHLPQGSRRLFHPETPYQISQQCGLKNIKSIFFIDTESDIFLTKQAFHVISVKDPKKYVYKVKVIISQRSLKRLSDVKGLTLEKLP